jgi:tetratricopeptide (TPR) repeat protein
VGAREVALAAGLKSNVFVQLAEAYRSQGRYEEAIATCQKGLEKMPDSLRGRLLLGKCYLEKNMIPQAKEELEKVVQEMEECFHPFELPGNRQKKDSILVVQTAELVNTV